VGDPLVAVREILDIPDKTLWDALGKVLEAEKELGIVVNVRGCESDFITAVSTFIGNVSKRTSGLKALLTSGPADDFRMPIGELSCIDIQYDKERKGLIVPFLDTQVSDVANKRRVPRYPPLR
jgi:hypothetical protein